MQANIDVLAVDHGSVWLLHPMSPVARDWFAEHLPDGPCLGRGRAVGSRYVDDVLAGCEADGLMVSS